MTGESKTDETELEAARGAPDVLTRVSGVDLMPAEHNQQWPKKGLPMDWMRPSQPLQGYLLHFKSTNGSC